MKVKSIFRTALALLAFFSIAACTQQTVSQKTMQKVFDEVKTPYKYGLVMVAPDEDKKTDSPSIFRKGDMWYMVYIVFDGKGYETWMAQSEDLLHWTTTGKLLSFSEDTDWDGTQKAGYIALSDIRWGGKYGLEEYDGKHWMSYLGGNGAGYEQGLLCAGMSYTDKDVTVPHEWTCLDKPVLSPADPDAAWWDSTSIFKSTVIRDEKQLTGHPFVMYYNAKGPFESIGMATSDDMLHWQRYGSEPLLQHGPAITGDAYIQKMGKLYVMFYFGCGWNRNKDIVTWDSFACSYDLVHWTDWSGEELVKSTEPYDSHYAHKPCMVKWKGVVYHFYCSVDEQDHRGIAVATSKDLGKSTLEYK